MREMNSPRRSLIVWVVAACFCVAAVGLIGVRHFVVSPFHIPSESMAPTLHEGEYILVDRVSRGTAERGHVVVFNGSGYFAAESGGGTYWVKRVIGVGGDRIRCCSENGALEVNGVELHEPYLPSGLTRASAQDFEVEVPKGRIFLLGDNRDHSSDSRDHLGDPGGGMIPLDRVEGHVTRVVWPLDKFREVGQ